MDGHGKIGRKRAAPLVAGPPPYLEALRKSAGLRSFYKSSGNCAALLETISECVTEHRISLLSVDIFDTALMRGPRSELARFRTAAERFHRIVRDMDGDPGFSVDDAFLARIAAAKAAYRMYRRQNAGGDPAFGEIAKTVSALLRRPDLEAHYIDSELATEIAEVELNPLLAALRHRFPKLRTIFLTDTYLEGPRVRRILTAALGTRMRPTVLSSADGFGSKAAGTLFAHAERTFRVEAGRALHIGDNLETDYLGPKRRGWHALHLPLPEAEIAARRASFEVSASTLDGFSKDIDFVP